MGHIYISITIDWEGESLDNVHDLVNIRKQIGSDIPFTHFICPNYFIRNSKRNISDKIKTAIEPIDEIGLHIHCYKELINSIPGIDFRTEENYHNTLSWFEKNIIQKLFPKYQRHISGRGVPLSVYTKDEIRKIIIKCRDLLQKNLNIADIKGFRAGGWIANDTVLDVVEELNFNYDSSAVSPSILSQGFSKKSDGNKLDDYGDKTKIFTEHLIKLWGYKTISQGFLKNKKILRFNKQEAIQINSKPFSYNSLLEIPNNCGLTDFCSYQKTLIPLIKEYQKALKEDPDKSYLIVYGCHQEGDLYYKDLLLEFIQELKKLESSEIKFIRMKDVLNLSL